MGYRSEVVFVVAKEVMPQFLATLAKSPKARALCFGETNMRVNDFCGTGNILFNWNGIKWHEGYEEIDAITDFMDWCDDAKIPPEEDTDRLRTEDGIYFYRFVRIGEENEDNVVRGWGFDDVNIERRITF